MAQKSKDGKKTDSTICWNKNATRGFHLMDRLEAGLVLSGTEVKSIRNGTCHINDAYAYPLRGELFLMHMHISPYTHGNRYNHDPLRQRKLLLKKTELHKLMGSIVEKGLTIVPTKLYWVRGRVKVELALAKGKNQGDKRDDVKRRDAQREIDKAVKRGR